MLIGLELTHMGFNLVLCRCYLDNVQRADTHASTLLDVAFKIISVAKSNNNQSQIQL